MGHLDWNAVVKGFVAYWLLSAPIYWPGLPSVPSGLAQFVTWLPYLAAFVAGAVFSRVSLPNRDSDCVALGLLIGLSVGLLNLAGPIVGYQSDLPGLKSSLVVATVASVISVVLVLAGAASKGFFGGNEKRT